MYRGSSEIVVSMTLMNAMGLSTQKHPKPYKKGCIKKGCYTTVTRIFTIPLSLRKYYQYEMDCDAIEMDACHILLGRHLRFNKDTIHKGKDNIYSFV